MNGVWVAVLLLLAAMGGGAVPLLVRRSERLLHQFLSIAAGFFLGVVFLHLLPELASSLHGQTGLWAWMLAGLLGLLVFELGVFGHRDHAVLGWATLAGLSAHSLAEGIGLGVNLDRSFVLVLVWGMLSHKAAEGFSLASALRLAGRSGVQLWGWLCVFALITPLGMALGWAFETSQAGGILAAISAGTFIYVAIGDLLPEVFHEERDRLLKLALLLVGVAMAAVVSPTGRGHIHRLGPPDAAQPSPNGTPGLTPR